MQNVDGENPPGREPGAPHAEAEVSVQSALEGIDPDPELFKRMVEAIPHLILYGNPDGSILYHNGALAQIKGMAGVSLIGNRWESIIHPEEREAVGKAHQRAFAMGRRCYGECRYLCGPQTYKAATYISVPMNDENGVFEYWVSVFTDISELKRVERNLLSSEAQNRTIINTLAEGLLILDDKTNIIFANQAIHGLLGYELEELQQMSIDQLLSRLPTGGKKNRSNEMIAHRKNGTRFYVQVSKGTYYLGYSAHHTLLLRDITQRKTMARALQSKNKALLRSNEALDQFASIASHDLREPLRKVKSFAQLLARRFPESLPEDGKDYLNRMSRAVDRMDQLIMSLLSYSRVTTDVDRFVLVSLDDVVADAVFDLEIALQESGGSVEREPLPELTGDPALLAQLFQNLISNSIKYRRENVPPVIRIHAEVTKPESDLDQAEVQIHVRDNGIGFDSRQADHIFHIFQRLHDEEYEGAGVGLAICRKIVERHGGTIEAFGMPGEGSIFSITLPCAMDPFKILE